MHGEQGRQPAVCVMQEYVILFIEINLETAASGVCFEIADGARAGEMGES